MKISSILLFIICKLFSQNGLFAAGTIPSNNNKLYLQAPGSPVVAYDKSLIHKFARNSFLTSLIDEDAQTDGEGSTPENPYVLSDPAYASITYQTLRDMLNMLRSENAYTNITDVLQTIDACEKLGLEMASDRICRGLGRLTIKMSKDLAMMDEVVGKFVKVPEGAYAIGSPDTETDHTDEFQHLVPLASYEIGETPVTQETWVKIMGISEYWAPNPSKFKNEADCDAGEFFRYPISASQNDTMCKNHPVEQVSWNDIRIDKQGQPAFLTKLNHKYARIAKFRLPFEAESEVAMRGTLPGEPLTAYVSGATAIAEQLNQFILYNANSNNKTHSVKSKSGTPFYVNSNNFGFRRGGVYEWQEDVYDSNYIPSPFPLEGSDRVIRDCGWSNAAPSCRSAHRNWGAPDLVSSKIGFRLVRTMF